MSPCCTIPTRNSEVLAPHKARHADIQEPAFPATPKHFTVDWRNASDFSLLSGTLSGQSDNALILGLCGLERCQLPFEMERYGHEGLSIRTI